MTWNSIREFWFGAIKFLAIIGSELNVHDPENRGTSDSDERSSFLSRFEVRVEDISEDEQQGSLINFTQKWIEAAIVIVFDVPLYTEELSTICCIFVYEVLTRVVFLTKFFSHCRQVHWALNNVDRIWNFLSIDWKH